MFRLPLKEFPSDAQLDAAEELFRRLGRCGLPWELEQTIWEFPGVVHLADYFCIVASLHLLRIPTAPCTLEELFCLRRKGRGIADH